jgi:hypothetical protein
MTETHIELLDADAVFRPRNRPWELPEYHVPFDELTGDNRYEQRAIDQLRQGRCVSIEGANGSGKSSASSWICRRLPRSHVALRIPVTGIEDPGSVGEVAKLTLSIVLHEISLAADDQRILMEARADSVATTRDHPRRGATLGGGPIPASVNLGAGSLREEFQRDRLHGEHLHALSDRLIPILRHEAVTPVFVFEDTEATVGADESRAKTEAFFRGPLRAFLEQVDAPTLVAIQSHLTTDSVAFSRLAPSLERVVIPLLDGRSVAVVSAILTQRIRHVGISGSAERIFSSEAIDALAAAYRHTGGNLRQVLSAAHEATQRAAIDRAGLVEIAHVQFGLAQ